MLKGLFLKAIAAIKRLFGRKRPRQVETKVAIVGRGEGHVSAGVTLASEPRRPARLRHRWGPNMPKYQPCPQCRAGSKRGNKTLNGANYHCRTHEVFFVRA